MVKWSQSRWTGEKEGLRSQSQGPCGSTVHTPRMAATTTGGKEWGTRSSVHRHNREALRRPLEARERLGVEHAVREERRAGEDGACSPETGGKWRAGRGPKGHGGQRGRQGGSEVRTVNTASAPAPGFDCWRG